MVEFWWPFPTELLFFLLICSLHAYNNLVPDSFSIWASLKTEKLFTRPQLSIGTCCPNNIHKARGCSAKLSSQLSVPLISYTHPYAVCASIISYMHPYQLCTPLISYAHSLSVTYTSCQFGVPLISYIHFLSVTCTLIIYEHPLSVICTCISYAHSISQLHTPFIIYMHPISATYP